MHAKCFSEHCSDRPAFRLGRLHEESDAYMTDAIRVNLRHLERRTVPPETLDRPGDLSAAPLDAFNVAVQRWLRQDARVLSLKSPMGSGKSTLLDALLLDLAPLASSEDILVVTYRQSLASEHIRKLRSHGFELYSDVEPRTALADRAEHPRVICQIESLHWLVGSTGNQRTPKFDLVILDESESLLRHLTSPTVTRPAWTLQLLLGAMRAATRGVVTMDAAWGALTHSILRRAELSNILVVNERPPASPRTFSVSGGGGPDVAFWLGRILEDLRAGLNVVVVSLSSEAAMAVQKAAADVVGADRTCLHTSKTGDELKKELVDVDALWTRFRLVVYSPTIAAGVDFSAAHFDRMYVHLCPMSALPATALQMAFRVRKLKDPVVRCVAVNMRLSLQGSRPPTTSALMSAWLRSAPSASPSASYDPFPRSPGFGKAEAEASQADPDLLEIESFVGAERQNANFGYLRELAALAEAAGHQVVLDCSHAAVTVRASPSDMGEESIAAMLSAALSPIDSEAELAALRERQRANTATEGDKWRIYLTQYLAAWGIDRVDAAFLAEHKTQPGSPKARLLCRVLCPALRRPFGADVGYLERAEVLKVRHVEETIAALGLRSPFDDATVVEDLMATFRTRLAALDMFANYGSTARLFQEAREVPSAASDASDASDALASASTAKTWTLNNVVKAINMVLGAAGLRLVGTLQPRVTVGGKRPKVFTYRLATPNVEDMLELVKLRLRAGGLAPPNAHASARLAACGLPKYGHLVD